MKAIRTKEVNENVKAANSCLRKAKWQAKELAVFTGEVVRLMDKEGHSLQGASTEDAGHRFGFDLGEPSGLPVVDPQATSGGFFG